MDSLTIGTIRLLASAWLRFCAGWSAQFYVDMCDYTNRSTRLPAHANELKTSVDAVTKRMLHVLITFIETAHIWSQRR